MNRRSRTRRRFLTTRTVLAAVCAVLPASGCGLFDTRDPEPPAVVRSTFDPPTEPVTVLRNMESAFSERNEVNYLRCLSDSLTAGALEFVPTPEASSRYGAFIGWTKANERDYFLSLRSRIPAGNAMSLVFGPAALEGLTSDSVTVDATYDLMLPHGQQALPDAGRGRAQFTMALDRRTGFWSVRRWRDFPAAGNPPSWSDVKGAFGQ